MECVMLRCSDDAVLWRMEKMPAAFVVLLRYDDLHSRAGDGKWEIVTYICSSEDTGDSLPCIAWAGRPMSQVPDDVGEEDCLGLCSEAGCIVQWADIPRRGGGDGLPWALCRLPHYIGLPACDGRSAVQCWRLLQWRLGLLEALPPLRRWWWSIINYSGGKFIQWGWCQRGRRLPVGDDSLCNYLFWRLEEYLQVLHWRSYFHWDCADYQWCLEAGGDIHYWYLRGRPLWHSAMERKEKLSFLWRRLWRKW